MTIKVAGATHESAKYAVLNWHYSRQMPIGKLIKFGVWENEKFIGVVLFGRGASPVIGNAYGLNQIEVCELVRVALTEHEAPVSQIVAESLKLLKQQNPKMRLVVSFADTRQKHHGGIYQAMNWIYTGKSTEAKEFFYRGKWYHQRMLGKTGFGGDTVLSKLSNEEKKLLPFRIIDGKHRYVYPLDKQIRRKVNKMSLPYPHAVEGLTASHDNSVVEVQVQFLPTAQIK